MIGAFQRSAFQNNAFQVDSGVAPEVVTPAVGGGIPSRKGRKQEFRKTIKITEGDWKKELEQALGYVRKAPPQVETVIPFSVVYDDDDDALLLLLARTLH